MPRQLPGINDIVPDAVESAGYGYHRLEEGISHPDGEDGVLLTERLRCGDLAAVFLPDLAPRPELEDAGGQRRYAYACQHPIAAVEVDYGAGAHQDGEGEAEAPDVE